MWCGGAVIFPAISGLQADPGEGESGLLRTFAAFYGKLFHQCAEFYLAWVSLSQQSSMQTVLYLHFPGAAGKL